ncbi:alpha/beta hydrolase-fold protein [Glaciihabitans sp. UYNi722]|uniref:alpha/beta hydrolase n=1 Tax=Glaciihabitans sp. UYNi722 TaxID=3156344 RepID=UPI00339676B2
MDAFLRMNIIDGPFVGVVYTLAVGAVLFLALRRPSRRWIVTATGALFGGSIVAFVLLWWVRATNAFGVDLSATTTIWVYVAFSAMCLAIVNLWKSRWPRKMVASVALVLFAVAGTVGINADFGLDRTVADLAGISTQKPIALPRTTPTPVPSRTPLAGGALWANWLAPKSQPVEGTIGSVVIPNTLSGFRSRPAGLYLPPAALVKDPPLLPLVVMMMGQPGNPDPSFQKPILDAFAARHNGLAPIVLVVDQLGDPAIDPLCLDTAKHGKSETFLVGDAVAWARANLHVLPDAAHWTIAGYSNGGECALSLGAKHPEIWGNVLDISGEEYPGSDRPNETLAQDFAGNRAAYQAARPLTVLAAHHYSDTFGIFTVGSNDGSYVTQARRVEAAAKASGWKTTYFEVPNGGHVLGALNGGLQEGYRLLYPRLGLSDPSTSP